MIINKIFFELSNEERYKVFRALFNENKRHIDLEKELNLPGSEVSRHLKRLKEEHLIRKAVNHQYSITNLGKIFYQILDIFEVSIKLREFFNTHSIEKIPPELIIKLGNLKTLEIGNKILQNIESWRALIRDADKYIYVIMDQFESSLIQVFEQKIQKKDTEIRVLLFENLVNSIQNKEEDDDNKNPLTIFKKIEGGKRVKMSNEMDFSLIVTEKGAMLLLSKDKMIDYNECLIDTHNTFIEWTGELFEEYWKRSSDL